MKGIPVRRETLIAIGLIAIVVVGSYWKLATMQGVVITDDIFASDIMNDGFPYRFYLGEALKGGELPLWYPPVYGGFPLLARAESGICYPPNILLFWLLDPYVALNAVMLLTVLTAGVGMYLYAREVGGGFHGSLLAGVSYAYCGFMISHMKHLSMVNSACWFPLGLLAIERALREAPPGERRSRVRSLLWLGVVFSLQNLAGHVQVAYYSALVYGAYYLARLFWLWRKQKTRSLRTLLGTGLARWLVAAVAAGCLVSAIQLVPTYELVQHSKRAGGVERSYAMDYPYDTGLFWSFFYPPVRGEPSSATYVGDGIFWEDYGYAGVVTIILAGVALFRERRSWHVRFFAASGLIAYLMVLGKNTPLYGIAFDTVPMMNYFRFPTRFLFVVDASIAVLGGIGLNHLVAGTDGPRRRGAGRHLAPLAATVILCVAIADLMFFQLRQNAVVSLDRWRSAPRTARMLQAEANTYRIFTLGAEETHVRAYQMAGGWEGNLSPFVEQREYLQPSLNVLFGFSTPNGYAQLTPAPVVEVWGDQNGAGLFTALSRPAGGYFTVRPPFKKLLSLHNVRTIISPLPIIGEQFIPRGIVGQVRLYENPDALPRAFIVGSYRIAANAAQSLVMLAGSEFQPSREAILFEKPGIIPRDSLSASARIVSYRTNDVAVESRASAPGILVLSDTWYPGWEADVDGSPVTLMRANHTMRAVVVPEGTHTVHFHFRSRSIASGFFLMLAGLGAMTLMMALPGRRAQ